MREDPLSPDDEGDPPSVEREARVLQGQEEQRECHQQWRGHQLGTGDQRAEAGQYQPDSEEEHHALHFRREPTPAITQHESQREALFAARTAAHEILDLLRQGILKR